MQMVEVTVAIDVGNEAAGGDGRRGEDDGKDGTMSGGTINSLRVEGHG